MTGALLQLQWDTHTLTFMNDLLSLFITATRCARYFWINFLCVTFIHLKSILLYTSDIVTAQVSEGERLKSILNNNASSCANKVIPTDLISQKALWKSTLIQQNDPTNWNSYRLGMLQITYCSSPMERTDLKQEKKIKKRKKAKRKKKKSIEHLFQSVQTKIVLNCI